MNTTAIELTHLRKAFGPLQALDDVSLTVPEGQIWGLLGHNGAGKTTLMKHLLGLLVPTGGEVRVLGRSPTGSDARALRREVGYLPETVAFYPELTGREILKYFARLKDVAPSQCERMLADVELTDAADRRARTYSNGMRQRLGLAQAMLGHPRLLLLDEPTAGLDPIATQRFYRKVKQLAGEGVSILLSSHILAGVERHVDRVAILGSGKLLAAGTLGELRARVRLPVVIRVRLSGAISEWPAVAGEEGRAAKRIGDGEFEFRVPEQGKLYLLQQLTARDDVVDLSVMPPTLDDVYAHYCGVSEQAPTASAEGAEQ